MKIGKSRKTPPTPTEKSKPVSLKEKSVAKKKPAEAPPSEIKKKSATASAPKKALVAEPKRLRAPRRDVAPTKPSVSIERTSAPVMPAPIINPAAKEAIEPPKVSTASVAEVAPEAKARVTRQPRPVPVEIPAILLEPDHVPNEPAIAGPGARFALTPSREPAVAAPEELPEAYGTERIFLAARDPYCLFASWDLDSKQRGRYNAASASGALTIRLRRGLADGPIALEVHTQPTARDRFIEVAHPDATFVAELGYHEKNTGLWRAISVSKPVTTPRDRVAPAPVVASGRSEPPKLEEAPVIPPSPTPRPRHEQIVFALQPPGPEAPRWEAKQEPEPLRDRPTWTPPKEKPRWTAPKPVPAPKWSPAKRQALDELISLESRRRQEGSLEIEEVLRRRILRTTEVEEEAGPSSLEMGEFGREEFLEEALGLAQPPSSVELAAQPTAKKGFWFKINAELIIYGSTEPDARVSIAGRPIRLRPDGTFSYRFALPDGAYELPVIAIAPDGHDGRAAELRFSRATRYSGEVGRHPQDAALKAPAPENL
ncbi:MAG TPA: DUF4912 domain-containing protein [Verrucomicrobiae bacterium]|nr:DUF4912 domain-containing protein [Verrucomicrobiae bacterium]